MPDENTLSTPPPDPTPPAEATPPATDPTPPESDPPATNPPPIDPPADDHGGDAATRIRGLLAENKALREYSEHWRGMALTPTGQPATPKTPATDPAQPEPAPKLKDFDSTEKWAEAHSAWTDREITRRSAAVVDTTLRTRDATNQQQQTADTYRTRMDEFEKTRPDARLVIANPTMTRALQQQPAIGEVVMASELGPQLAVHLSENPAELVRISRLPAAQAAHALGRIEAGLAAKAGTPPPTPPKPGSTTPPAPARKPAPGSRAPEPPNPIGGGGTPTVDDMNLPLDQFLAKLNRRGAK